VIKKRGSKVDVVAETLGGTLITQLLFIAAHLFSSGSSSRSSSAHIPRVYIFIALFYARRSRSKVSGGTLVLKL
jgi:hypothetical protein